MKLVWLKKLFNFKISDQNPNENPDESDGRTRTMRQVVRIEDCERINRIFEMENNQKQSARNQYLAALLINIIALSVGVSIGWTSPFLSVLQSSSSPLEEPLTEDQASWVGSLFGLGALFGTLLFGWLSEVCGRFKATILSALPEIVCWTSLIYGSSTNLLFFGRFLSGLTAGGVFVLVPLYISEISEDSTRGILGSFFLLSVNIGTLVMFIAGNYLDYSIVPIIMILIPIVFVVTFTFLPETPQFLLKSGKAKKAEKSLKFLRGCEKKRDAPERVKKELLRMSKKIEDTVDGGKQTIWNDLKTKPVRKALLIGFVLVLINQLCGCFAFINYAADIFMESGSSLTPNWSAIVVAFIQVAGSAGSALAIAFMPRKVLYSLSCLGTFVGLIAFGAHGFVKSFVDVSDFNWIPIVSLSFVIFVASIGLMPLTFIILSEILPQKVRSFGVSICSAILWGISFLLLRYFAALASLVQLYGCMFIFAGFTLFGMVFVICFVPETKNKSSDDIEKSLGY